MKSSPARHLDSSSIAPEDLLAATSLLAESLGLVGAVTYGRRDSKIATIEALTHEIAHCIFTGPAFETLLLSMSLRATNRHEASALRIETAVLDCLGCKVALHTLWQRANWNTDTGNKRPSWVSMTMPLTVREDRCKRIILRRLQGFLDELRKR